MRYEGAARRRGRQLRRFAEAATIPAARGAAIVPTFWWDGHPNFGDDLTPWLLPRYGVVPQYSEPRHADLIGVGSLLEFLTDSHQAAIWGAGLMEDRAHPLPRVTVLAVRGPLTAERIGVTKEPAYGDPGILVSRHLPRPSNDERVAVVPHGHHRGNADLTAMLVADADRVNVINVHQRAVAAIRDIARSSVVLTTSLHGLITADSYGIPAVWTTLDPPLTGGDFKFRDYEAVVTPGRTRFRAFIPGVSLDDMVADAWAADPERVRIVADGVERAIVGFRAGAQSYPRFPAGMARAVLRR